MARKSPLVTGEQDVEQWDAFFRRLAELIRQLKDRPYQISAANRVLQALIERRPYLGVTDEELIEELAEAENRFHCAFFDQTFELTVFQETLARLGQEKLRQWAEMGLEVHYLPRFVFTQQAELPGWKIKPSNCYWRDLADGRIYRKNVQNIPWRLTAMHFGGFVVLVDTRLKPQECEERQMFENDSVFLGGLLERLRQEDKITRHHLGLDNSRFAVSSDDCEQAILPALETMIPEARWRLETYPEFNVIAQLFPHMPRARDGETATMLWFDECSGDGQERLYGGRSESAECGGLAEVSWHWHDKRCGYGAFRPLGIFD